MGRRAGGRATCLARPCLAALLPDRLVYDPAHRLGYRRPLDSGPDYLRKLAAGIFARLKQIAPTAYDRIVWTIIGTKQDMAASSLTLRFWRILHHLHH